MKRIGKRGKERSEGKGRERKIKGLARRGKTGVVSEVIKRKGKRGRANRRDEEGSKIGREKRRGKEIE